MPLVYVELIVPSYLASGEDYLLSYYAPPPSYLASGEDFLASGEGYLASGEDYLLSYYALPPSPSSMQARPFRDLTFGVLVL